MNRPKPTEKPTEKPKEKPKTGGRQSTVTRRKF